MTACLLRLVFGRLRSLWLASVANVAPGIGALLFRNLVQLRFVSPVPRVLSRLLVRRQLSLLVLAKRYARHRHLRDGSAGQNGQYDRGSYDLTQHGSAPPSFPEAATQTAAVRHK